MQLKFVSGGDVCFGRVHTRSIVEPCDLGPVYSNVCCHWLVCIAPTMHVPLKDFVSFYLDSKESRTVRRRRFGVETFRRRDISAMVVANGLYEKCVFLKYSRNAQ